MSRCCLRTDLVRPWPMRSLLKRCVIHRTPYAIRWPRSSLAIFGMASERAVEGADKLSDLSGRSSSIVIFSL